MTSSVCSNLKEMADVKLASVPTNYLVLGVGTATAVFGTVTLRRYFCILQSKRFE